MLEEVRSRFDGWNEDWRRRSDRRIGFDELVEIWKIVLMKKKGGDEREMYRMGVG